MIRRLSIVSVLLVVCVVLVSGALPSVFVDHKGVSRTRIYENILPPQLIERMKLDAIAISGYETGTLKDNKKLTRWMPKGAFPRTALEEAITRLQPIVKPEHGSEVIAGCEWWVQYVNAHDPIGFHLDKDESIASNKHYLVHPVYGTILYLSDVGGPTLIIDQYSPNGNGYLPEKPEEAELIYPKPNKFAIFKGHLLHGVVAGDAARANKPGTEPPKRLTFLMNWWTIKPEAPNCELLPNPSVVTGLRVFTPSEMEEFRNTFDSTHKPKRISIGSFDLLEGGSESRVYPFKLPGGIETSVRLPLRAERGGSYTLRWIKKAAETKTKSKSTKSETKKKPKAAAAATGGSDKSEL